MKINVESKPFDAVDLKENNDSNNNNITKHNSFIINGNNTMPSHTNINNTESKSNITPSAISKTKDENVTLNVEEIEDQGLCFEITFLIYFGLLSVL